ncbi:hypothetical protein [Bradyrhizobium sp. LA6.7]|uniref:hypothetical protein n=1 Tax=unclassified Bradyrhizobium TaxID=2631580 RepID=UPI0033946ADE
MFKIVDKRTFTHEVKVFTPTDGGFSEDLLKATFNYVPTDRVASFDLSRSDDTTSFLREIVVRFSDLVDEQDQPIACTDELRERLLFVPNVRQALITHYFEAVNRIAEGN